MLQNFNIVGAVEDQTVSPNIFWGIILIPIGKFCTLLIVKTRLKKYALYFAFHVLCTVYKLKAILSKVILPFLHQPFRLDTIVWFLLFLGVCN